MSSRRTTITYGGNFTSLLALLFIGLKVTGLINWSWWWVLAPLWMPFAIIPAVVIIAWVGFFFLGRYFKQKQSEKALDDIEELEVVEEEED